MNLYLKYRPKSFDEVVGNEDVVSYLETIVEETEKRPNVLLFHGQTGCGKTTLARIVANKVGCVLETDFIEINSANFRGIDTVRDLIKNSRYRPMGGDVRVWLIDEVHKMTNDAQNALLKLLEDTPESSYFMLCTTEPNKLLPTVRGRCVDLQVKPLTDEQMFFLLRSIVKAEGAKLNRAVYDQIIDDSFGLPRNAIQVLEKILNVPSEKQMEMAKKASEEQSQSIELCRALTSGSGWHKVKNILSGLKDQEAESIRRHVLAYAQTMLLKSENDIAAHVIEEFWEPLYNIGFPGLVFACYSVVKK